jgi:hypothetical protein
MRLGKSEPRVHDLYGEENHEPARNFGSPQKGMKVDFNESANY